MSNELDQTSEENFETEADETVENTEAQTEIEQQEPDYKKKFSESSKEALKIKEERDSFQRELEEMRNSSNENDNNFPENEEPYPGFNDMDEESQRNILAYTNSIKRNVLAEINKDPAISMARSEANQRKWDKAFSAVQERYPDLKEHSSSFKEQNFKSNKPTPDNIEEILESLSKAFLYDKAKDIGATEARQQSSRIEIERQGSTESIPSSKRSLEDWQRMAQTNPAKFAKESKEFNEDISSGKLK